MAAVSENVARASHAHADDGQAGDSAIPDRHPLREGGTNFATGDSAVGSRNIDIPAGDAHCVVSDEYVVPTDLDLRSIFPHAHSLCRQMKVDATLPDGTTKPLVEIKDFDEKWHDDYQFVEPVRVPKGTRHSHAVHL